MIYLSQWLCPSRHCAFAFMWEAPPETEASVEARGEALFAPGVMNRHCGICGGDLAVEHRETPFRSLAEASAAGRAVEAEQVLTRAELWQLGLSKEPPPPGWPRAS